MGQRKKYWQAMGPNAEDRIPGSTVRGKKDGNVQTLPMSDRKRGLVKKWLAAGPERKKNW
jgi:hypothetical protein